MQVAIRYCIHFVRHKMKDAILFRLSCLPAICALVFIAACSPRIDWHPLSYFEQGKAVPFHHRIVWFGDTQAVVAGTRYPITVSGGTGEDLWHGHGVREDVEVMPRRNGQPFPSDDVAFAKSLVQKACRVLDVTALQAATPTVRADGYYRFEGVGCAFFYPQ